jgi:hypothetical protein
MLLRAQIAIAVPTRARIAAVLWSAVAAQPPLPGPPRLDPWGLLRAAWLASRELLRPTPPRLRR